MGRTTGGKRDARACSVDGAAGAETPAAAPAPPSWTAAPARALRRVAAFANANKGAIRAALGAVFAISLVVPLTFMAVLMVIAFFYDPIGVGLIAAIVVGGAVGLEFLLGWLYSGDGAEDAGGVSARTGR